MKDSGNGGYYMPLPQILGINQVVAIRQKSEGLTPYISTSPEELSLYTNPVSKGLDAIPKGFLSLPNNLKMVTF